jgi:hypothetical protein
MSEAPRTAGERPLVPRFLDACRRRRTTRAAAGTAALPAGGPGRAA